MNETKELEMLLRAWAPRPPSPKLEERVFRPARPAKEPARPRAMFGLSLLAPATAALLLVCGLFNQRNCTTFAVSSHSGPWVAMILSNQSAAAFLPGSFQQEANSLPADTLEWTNEPRSVLHLPSRAE